MHGKNKALSCPSDLLHNPLYWSVSHKVPSPGRRMGSVSSVNTLALSLHRLCSVPYKGIHLTFPRPTECFSNAIGHY